MISWKLVPFDGLSLRELHDLLQLRAEVFVVEQNCVFQDIDGADGDAMHLLGTQVVDGSVTLVAYARCFAAGVKYPEASIGRVVTKSLIRGSGAGHLLIQQALQSVAAQWGMQPIRIGAQAQLASFYGRHGFVDVGKSYVEDGIDHIEMLWRPSM